MALLSVKNLTLAYEAAPVVKDLSFDVSRGDNLVIVGENGSGKSTLMRALMGLKAPESGRILLGDGLTQRKIGYLPQQSAHAQDFPASVREVVLSGTLASGGRWFYRRDDLNKMRQALAQLGIADLESHSYQALSGGQRQRVLLARALCAAVDLLLLDEPTAGLDPEASAALYQTLLQLNRAGVTLISVSHDLSGALASATHVLHLGHHSGWFGTAAQYRADFGQKGVTPL